MTTQDGQRYQLSRLLYSQHRLGWGRQASGSNQPRVPPTLQDVNSISSCLSAEQGERRKKLKLILLRCSDKSISKCDDNPDKQPSKGCGSCTTAIEKKGSLKRRSVACSIKLSGTPVGRSVSPGFLFSDKAGSTKSVQSKCKIPSFIQKQELAQSQQFAHLISENNSGMKEGNSPLEIKSVNPLTIQPFLSRKRADPKKGPKVSVGIKIAPKIFDVLGVGMPSKQPKVIFGFPESWKPSVCKRIELKDSTGPVISFETLRKEAKTSLPMRSSSGASSLKKTDGAFDHGKTTEQMKSSVFKSLKSKHLSCSESKVFSEDLCHNKSSRSEDSYD